MPGHARAGTEARPCEEGGPAGDLGPRAGVGGTWRTEALALLAIVALAAAIRWYRLADLPYGLWFDTAEDGNVALRILRDRSYRPVFVGDLTQLPAIYLYLVAASIRLLGATPFALRSVGAAAGIATVVAVWGAGRALFGPRVGLIAAALAAGSSWLLAIDRLAIGSVLVPASIAGAVWCVGWGGDRSPPLALWPIRCAAAAAVTAVGLYGYWGAYVEPPIIGLLIVVVSARRADGLPAGRRARAFWSSAVVGAAAYGIALLVALAPLGVYAWTHAADVGQRAATVSAFGAVAGGRDVSPAESALRHALMPWVWGDRNGRHNLAGAPELDSVTGALVLVGAASLIAARGARSRAAWLFAWIGIGLIAGIASTPSEAPNAHRTIAVVPAVLLLAAVGADRLASVAPLAIAPAAFVKRCVKVVAGAAVALCALAVGLGAWRFLAQQASAVTQAASSPTETLLARDVDALPGSTKVYVGRGVDRGHPTVRFLSHRASASGELGAATYIPPGTPIAVYLSPADASALDAVRALIPGTRLAPIGPPGGPALLERVDATGPRIGRGLVAASFGGKVELTGVAVRADDRQPGSYWLALGIRAQRDAPGYISASLRATDDADNVWGQQDGLGDADLSKWKAGDSGLVLVHLHLRGGTRPGRLQLTLRLYDLVTGAVLPVDSTGLESLGLGPIAVAQLVPTSP